MKDKELLQRIANRFTRIAKDDLTTLEKSVVSILVANGYLRPDGERDGETYILGAKAQ